MSYSMYSNHDVFKQRTPHIENTQHKTCQTNSFWEIILILENETYRSQVPTTNNASGGHANVDANSPTPRFGSGRWLLFFITRVSSQQCVVTGPMFQGKCATPNLDFLTERDVANEVIKKIISIFLYSNTPCMIYLPTQLGHYIAKCWSICQHHGAFGIIRYTTPLI